MTTPHVVVVGAGISGLTAAYRLSATDAACRVTLVEASNRLGGKIATTPFGGVMIDEGADAFLARVPHGIDLCRELGIDVDFISPSSKGAFVVSRGKLRRLPDGLMLGVPTRLRQVVTSGIVSPLGLLRAGLDLVKPNNWDGEDESVGDLVTRRMGREVAERLVDPLVGSISASDTFNLSAQLATPQIAEVARNHRSLIRGLRALQKEREATDLPLFYSFQGGVSVLVDRLVAELTAVDIRTNSEVTAIEVRPDGGYRLVTPSGPIDADAVILAAPARVAAPLVAPHAASASRILTDVEYASVSLVTMAFRSSDIGNDLDGSGLLVAPDEDMLMTAASFGHRKWPHWTGDNDDRIVMRVSAGRFGDDRAMQLDDDELVESLANELAALLDIEGPVLEWRVSRWPLSFPQYRPGHSDRIALAESDLSSNLPGVELTGSSYRGVGIPACIRQGNEAAARIIERLASA